MKISVRDGKKFDRSRLHLPSPIGTLKDRVHESDRKTFPIESIVQIFRVALYAGVS